LQNISTFEDINSSEIFVDNHFKACKISKNIQDLMFYRYQLYNEIYSINNTSETIDIENKYKNISFFNHRKNEISDILDLSQRGLEKVYTNEDVRTFEKFDIIRFGINYDLVKMLQDNKLLNVRVYVSNHKYPEIVFKPFDFYYTPTLTNITPSSFNMIKNNSTDTDNVIGYYDFSGKDFSSKYSVITTNQAYLLLLDLIKKRNIANKLFNNDISYEIDPAISALSMLKHMQMSCWIKDANFIKNKIFDENKINSINFDKNGIISSSGLNMYKILSNNSFEKAFLESKNIVQNYLTTQDKFAFKNSKQDLIENNIHSLEFFKLIGKDTSIDDMLLEFTTEKYFDIFSIKISREAIRSKINGGEEEVKRLYNLSALDELPMSNLNFDDSYSYVIEMQVI